MSLMRLEHVAIWTRDLERMRAFYVSVLGGRSGPRYENPRTGFRSYFVEFDAGARLELMARPDGGPDAAGEPAFGYAHVAFRVGSRAAVDAWVGRLANDGVVTSGPRTTGDGYYEAVLRDPEGNAIELMASSGPRRASAAKNARRKRAPRE